MTDLIHLLILDGKVGYDKEYIKGRTYNEILLDYLAKKITQTEILSHIIYLDCSSKDLIMIPDLPKCQELKCDNNRLTVLPELSNCQYLNCESNRLTILPELPNCRELHCSCNYLTTLPKLSLCQKLSCYCNQLMILPELPNCIGLYCDYNRLTILSEFSNCKYLTCSGNHLPFRDLESFKKLWRFRSFYLGLKYVRLMYKRMLIIKAIRKRELHLELKYSPNLPFYKEDEYYVHFKNSIKKIEKNNSRYKILINE